MSQLNPGIAAVTDRITERSRDLRADYLQQVQQDRQDKPVRGQLSCGMLVAV